jgi:hypothetical protein
MNLKQTHHVFEVEYNVIMRELVTPLVIRDILSKRHLRLERVIWDTGATSSVINSNYVAQLGLIPTGQSQCHTANGVAIVNTYVVELHLPNNVGISQLNITDGNLGPQTDMLIGMDVISLGDFAVQIRDGKTVFSFAMPPFETKYDMYEKAERVNKQIQKANAKLLLKKS